MDLFKGCLIWNDYLKGDFSVFTSLRIIVVFLSKL